MADCLDDAEFWLPPQFLTDEDFILDRKGFTPRGAGGDGVVLDRLWYGSGSGLSSPVDSLLGSLEADSDEEDPMANLTRKMANSTLEDGFKTAEPKVRLSGSPQSTLCPRWDMLCEAAGEVARFGLSEQLYSLGRSRGGGEALHSAHGRRSPTPVPMKTQSSDGGFSYSHYQNSLTYQQLVASQIQLLKQQRAMLKQQQQRPGATWGLNSKPVNGPYHTVKTCGRKPDSASGGRQLPAKAASAWPPMQHQIGAGMRAVFLGAPPGGKRECAGTGVFLPRRAVTPAEPRKKQAACSTVLLPDKVVRALNLNLENMDARSQLQYRFNGCSDSESEYIWNLRRNSGVTAQQNYTGCPRLAPMNHDIHLPQEWNY